MVKRSSKSATKAAVRSRHLEWLQDLERWTGKSLSRIADEAGLSDTTLTRLRRENDGTLLDVTIQAIKQRHQVPGPFDNMLSGNGRILYAREEATPYDVAAEDDANLKRAIEALVAKRNAVFCYRLKTRALELSGYLPGDIVLVDQNRPPAHNDAVCAQIVDYRTGSAETVWRLFQQVGGVRLLQPRAQDAEAFAGYVVDDDRVSIAGVIVGAVRPEKRAG